MEEADWLRLITQLRHGDCTPILGAGASYGTLPTAAEFSRSWALDYQYPFTDQDDLARVMQYAAVTTHDTVYVKQLVGRQFAGSPPPDFSEPAEPHALLAQFPFPVFLTTNYDDSLVNALLRAGKRPRQVVCPWYERASYDSEPFELQRGLDPRPEEPLVYHLHGSLQLPESLVLTEDDYLQFLVKMAAARTGGEGGLLPGAVLNALTSRALLFVGYSFQDWAFRVLFHGLLRTLPDIQRRRHVGVQILPPLNNSVAAAEERARAYLTRYLEGWRISIFWGTAHEFSTELQRRIGSS